MEGPKIYYQMEAASGRTVRVPANHLKTWMEEQAAIEKAEKQGEKESTISENSEKKERQDDNRLYFEENLQGYITENRREEWLMIMINVLARDIGLDEYDQVLMVIQLNSDSKIDRFKDWLTTKIVDGVLHVTPKEVMNITARIGRGAPLD